MKRFIFVLCLLLIPLFASGKTLTHLSIPIQPSSRNSTAVRLVQEHGAELGTKNPNIKFSRIHPIPNGQVIRLEQTYRGLPVIGGDVAVVVQNNQIIAMNGKLQAIPSSVIADSPRRKIIDIDAAKQKVMTAIPSGRINNARLAYWAGPPFASQEVWVIEVFSPLPFESWEVLVSALSGQILWVRSTLVEAKARVYEINPNKGGLVEKTLQGLTSSNTLVGEFADVSSCYGSAQTGTEPEQWVAQCTRLATPDGQGNYYYNPLNDKTTAKDPFTEVQAYYHLDTFHRWFATNFGYFRPNGVIPKARVNYYFKYSSGKTSWYNNAQFNNVSGPDRGFYFGYMAKNTAYDAECIAHEFTHSVVDETSKLYSYLDSTVINTSPLSINEGFADLFSQFYSGDPIQGDYDLGANSRNLEGNTTCPTSLTGESHADGLIWSQALWAIRNKAANKKSFEKIAYQTMTSLTTHSGFIDAAALFLQFAPGTDASLVTLAQEEFKKRGVDTCSSIIPLSPNIGQSIYHYPRKSLSGAPYTPGTLQIKINVPQNATKLEITIAGNGPLANQFGGFIKKGEVVTIQNNNTYSYDFQKTNNANSFVLSTTDTQHRLVPGVSYYVLSINEADLEGYMTISYQLTPPSGPLPTLDKGVITPKDAGLLGKDVNLQNNDGGSSGSSGSNDADISGDSKIQSPQTTDYVGYSCTMSKGSSVINLRWALAHFIFAAIFLTICFRKRTKRQ